MKPYSIIDMPAMRVLDIAEEIYNYIDYHTDLLQTNALGWNFLNTIELLSESPELVNFFNQQKLLVRDSAVTITIDNTQLPMHIDESPVIAKINFPVSNTAGWVNRWYHISEEQLAKCPITTNRFGKEVVDLSGITDAEVIAEVIGMQQPMVFNSSIPHSVVKLKNEITTPRIVASFTFHNEPLKWLK